MVPTADFDWPSYFRRLDQDEARALACWLAAEGLGVGEFTEVVDRAYAAASDHWHDGMLPYITECARPTATAYAHRKHRFAGLMAALEEALLSGALPGDVSPRELRPCASEWTKQPPVEELLRAIARAGGGLE